MTTMCIKSHHDARRELLYRVFFLMEGGRTSKNDILFIYSEREHIEKQKNLVKLLSISKKKKGTCF